MGTPLPFIPICSSKATVRHRPLAPCGGGWIQCLHRAGLALLSLSFPNGYAFFMPKSGNWPNSLDIPLETGLIAVAFYLRIDGSGSTPCLKLGDHLHLADTCGAPLL
jgi:hypothetical protein